jgi:hypothetical protein
MVQKLALYVCSSVNPNNISYVKKVYNITCSEHASIPILCMEAVMMDDGQVAGHVGKKPNFNIGHCVSVS